MKRALLKGFVLASLLSGFLIAFFALNLGAQEGDPATALEWLRERQLDLGAWGKAAELDRDSFYDTSVILESLEHIEAMGTDTGVDLLAVKAYMSRQNPATIDFKARQIIAVEGSGIPTDDLYVNLMADTSFHGGVGIKKDFQPDLIDTALLVKAMALEDLDPALHVDYIISKQKDDGSWSYEGSDETATPNVFLTVKILGVFQGIEERPEVRACIDQGMAYLAANQNADGGYGADGSTVYESALVHRLFSVACVHENLRPAIITCIETQQDANGSFGSSPFLTALAAEALIRSQTPDLAWSGESITFSPNPPKDGQAAALTLTLENLGDGDAGSFSARLVLKSTEEQLGDAVSIASLVANSTVPVTFNWTPTDCVGYVDLVIEVDSEEEVPELSEQNNSHTLSDVFFEAGPKAVESGITIENQFFSPDGDGIQEATTLGFTLSGDATVEVKILDSGENLVSLLLDNASLESGNHTVTWDGRRADGTLAADGIYYFVLTIKYLDGTERSVRVTVIVDNNNEASVAEFIPETLHRIELPQDHIVYCADLVWSPDNSMIAAALVGKFSFSHFLHVVCYDAISGELVSSTTQTELLFDADASTYSGLAWSPDNERILVSTGAPSGTPGSLYLLVPDGEGGLDTHHVLDSPNNISSPGFKGVESPVSSPSHWRTFEWSPDGTYALMVETSWDSEARLGVVDLTDPEADPLPTVWNWEYEVCGTPGWTANGKIVVPNLSGNTLDIFNPDFSGMELTLESSTPFIDGENPFASMVHLKGSQGLWIVPSVRENGAGYSISGCDIQNLKEFGEVQPDSYSVVCHGYVASDGTLTSLPSGDVLWASGLPLAAVYGNPCNPEDKVDEIWTWDFSTGTKKLVLAGAEKLFEFSPNGQFILHSRGGMVQILTVGKESPYAWFPDDGKAELFRFAADSLQIGYINSVGELEIAKTATANLKAEIKGVIPKNEAYLEIVGTAYDRNLLCYELSYGLGEDPTTWTQIKESDIGVLGGTLGIWVPPAKGVYTVKLDAYDQAGNRGTDKAVVSWAFETRLHSLKTDWDYISPNGDSVQDEVTISYTVTEPGVFGHGPERDLGHGRVHHRQDRARNRGDRGPGRGLLQRGRDPRDYDYRGTSRSGDHNAKRDGLRLGHPGVGRGLLCAFSVSHGFGREQCEHGHRLCHRQDRAGHHDCGSRAGRVLRRVGHPDDIRAKSALAAPNVG